MLRWRLLLGVLFTAVLVGLLVADYWLRPPGVVLVPVVVFVAALSTAELLGLLDARRLAASPQVVYPANVLLVMAAAVGAWSRRPVEPAVGQTWAFAVIAVATVAALADEMRRYRAPGESLERLAATMLGVAYLGVMLSFLVSLRLVGGGAWGTLAIVSLLVVVKFGDIGAYTVGRLVGRHRMAPTLSPGKTIEGAAGAVAMGIFGAWFSLVWLAPMMLPAPSASAVHTHDVASRDPYSPMRAASATYPAAHTDDVDSRGGNGRVARHDDPWRETPDVDASLQMTLTAGLADVADANVRQARAGMAGKETQRAVAGMPEPVGASGAASGSTHQGPAAAGDSDDDRVAANLPAAAVPLAAWRWVLYGLLLSVAGMAGDLAESLLKRDAGVKDSSQWMPGFGGVLDLLDSVLLAAPVAYWCWSWGLVGF